MSHSGEMEDEKNQIGNYDQHAFQAVQNHQLQQLTGLPIQNHSQLDSDGHLQMQHQLDYSRQFAEQLRNHIDNEHNVHLQHLDASEAAQLQHQLESVTQQMSSQINSDVDPSFQSPSHKKRKHEKESQLNTCLALGCDRQIKQRRLCPMHQKQKERSGGKLDLKENVRFSKGRTPTPFSKHANKYAKLKTFDKKIDEWAGGREEGTLMLEAYMESSYHQSRFPKQEDTKIFEQIGKNIVEFMKQLPEKSPLRRPLIKAMSENVPLARLREVLPVSKQTVINSKKLSDQDNLLLTIKYKPNVTRNRKRGDGSMSEMGVPDDTIVNALTDEMSGYSSHQPLSLSSLGPMNNMNINSISGMNMGSGINSMNTLPSFNMQMSNGANINNLSSMSLNNS